MSDTIISHPVWHGLQGHARRYADLPTHPPNLQLPADDGDMAELRELRARLFELSPLGGGPLPTAVLAARAAVAAAAQLGCTADDVLDARTDRWPDDAVPAMLAAWPAPIVCAVVCP